MVEKLTEIQLAIVNEIYKAIELKDPTDFNFLMIVGSWGDTLPEADVLLLLKKLNERRT